MLKIARILGFYLSLFSIPIFGGEASSLEFLGDLAKDETEANVLIVGSVNAPRVKVPSLERLHGADEILDYTRTLPWARKTWTNDIEPSRIRSSYHILGDIAEIKAPIKFGTVYMEMLPSMFEDGGTGDHVGKSEERSKGEVTYPIEDGLKNIGKMTESGGKLIIEHIPLITYTTDVTNGNHPSQIVIDRLFLAAWTAYSESFSSAKIPIESIKKWVSLFEKSNIQVRYGRKVATLETPKLVKKRDRQLFVDPNRFIEAYQTKANFALWISAIFTEYYWEKWVTLLAEAGFDQAEFFILKDKNPINNRTWCLYITAIKS